MSDLRDSCSWRNCRNESTMIYYGAGLCDEHWAQACEVYKPTREYLMTRVVPEAARIIQEQHETNTRV